MWFSHLCKTPGDIRTFLRDYGTLGELSCKMLYTWDDLSWRKCWPTSYLLKSVITLYITHTKPNALMHTATIFMESIQWNRVIDLYYKWQNQAQCGETNIFKLLSLQQHKTGKKTNAQFMLTDAYCNNIHGIHPMKFRHWSLLQVTTSITVWQNK